MSKDNPKIEAFEILIVVKASEENYVEYITESIAKAKELILNEDVIEISLMGHLAEKRKVEDLYKFYIRNEGPYGDWRVLNRKVF